MWQAKINSSKPPWPSVSCVLQNSSGPANYCSPSLPPCPAAGTGHCPFIAWISFPKAFYYYFCYYIKGLAQLRQVPEQCEVWEHQAKLWPSCPCSPLQVWRCHLHHLSHSHSPKLFSYFIVVTISEGHLSSTFGHARHFLLAGTGDPTATDFKWTQ